MRTRDERTQGNVKIITFTVVFGIIREVVIKNECWCQGEREKVESEARRNDNARGVGCFADIFRKVSFQ